MADKVGDTQTQQYLNLRNQIADWSDKYDT